MKSFYNIRCNQYARMSSMAYKNYMEHKKTYDLYQADNVDILSSPTKYLRINELISAMDDLAVATIIFQAIAIEAYVNLAGMYFIGEDEYYKTYKNKPIIQKLTAVADRLNGEFSGNLLKRTEVLFSKRNSLVHQKPKAYNISIPPYNYDDFSKNFENFDRFVNEQTLAYENIDKEVRIYMDIQEEFKKIRGSKLELLEEIQSAMPTNSVML